MKVLITGAGGLLGQAAARAFEQHGMSVVALSRAHLDVCQSQQIERALGEHQPDVLLNCAAFTRVDDAEAHASDAFMINATGARNVAGHCSSHGVRVIYPSTDYVFDGVTANAWLPDQPRRPVNAYGRSKSAGEDATRSAADHLIVRTSWLFGRGGPNFVRTVTTRLHEGGGLRVVADQHGRPTYARDLAHAIARLVMAKVAPGTYHVANAGATTWFEYAREIARQLGADENLVTACTSAEFERPAPRPANSVLDTMKSDALIGPLRPWRDALADAIRSQDY